MTAPEWLAPRTDPSQGQAGEASDASGRQPAQQGGKNYVGQFILYAMISGLIGVLLSSWFPVALAACLFFTNDDYVEWLLQKLGIRFVPDTLGPEFIKIFVFLMGWWALLAYWKDSVPAWLAPPGDLSWPIIAGAALALAVLNIIATAVVRRRLPPWLKIQIASEAAVVWLSVLGAVAVIVSSIVLLNWFGRH